jgi:hypothetical protein
VPLLEVPTASAVPNSPKKRVVAKAAARINLRKRGDSSYRVRREKSEVPVSVGVCINRLV